MAYNRLLANRIRVYLKSIHNTAIEEKNMFGGLAFMVNGKMCVNVSHQNMMCRFDPNRISELKKRKGFIPMIMKGKEMKGYCYVSPESLESNADFEFWLTLCLDFNNKATTSKK